MKSFTFQTQIRGYEVTIEVEGSLEDQQIHANELPLDWFDTNTKQYIIDKAYAEAERLHLEKIQGDAEARYESESGR